MSRIPARFEALRRQHRKALIPFITAGDPQPDVTVPLMHALVRAGADLLELGVPFSDPMADGPVIQAASERALRHGVTLRGVLAMVQRFRETDLDTPVVLMGYLNPIEVMTYPVFARAAAAAGVDGVLTVDLPPEEAGEFLPAMSAAGLDTIFLVAPTTSDRRIARIAAAASGFLYYVSLRGVTGASHLDVAEVQRRLERIRRETTLPLGVGFGIKDPETAQRMAELADAVVVGSAVVGRIAELADRPERILTEVPAFIARLRAAMDHARLTA